MTETESKTEFQNLTTHCAVTIDPSGPTDAPIPPTSVCNLAKPTALAGSVTGESVEDVDDESYKIALDFPISLWGNTFSMIGISTNGVSLIFFPAIAQNSRSYQLISDSSPWRDRIKC